jgi:hypothetical protein
VSGVEVLGLADLKEDPSESQERFDRYKVCVEKFFGALEPNFLEFLSL